MVESFFNFIKYLGRQYANYRTHIVVRIVYNALSLVVLMVCFWLIGRQIADGYTTLISANVQFSRAQIVVSAGCITAGILFGAWEWTLLVNAVGGELEFGDGFQIHLTSNLAKYVPGFIWPYAGRVFMAGRCGTPSSVAVLSVACELLVVYVTGATLAIICLPYSDIVPLLGLPRLLLVMLSVILSIVMMIFAPILIDKVVKKLTFMGLIEFRNIHIDRKKFSFAILAVLLTWGFVGFGFSQLFPLDSHNAWKDISRSIIALVTAMLVGQVAVFVPLGLGVREAVLIGLLGSSAQATTVVIVAVVFRLESLLAEAISAVAVLIWGRLCRFSRK